MLLYTDSTTSELRYLDVYSIPSVLLSYVQPSGDVTVNRTDVLSCYKIVKVCQEYFDFELNVI